MKKIIIISLANEFGDKVAKKVADALGLLYLNVEDYIQYALANEIEMLETCGAKYVKQQTAKHIEVVSEFENTLFYCTYDAFIKNRNVFSDFKKIYLALSLKQLKTLAERNRILSRITFPDRDKLLSKDAVRIENGDLDIEKFAEKAINEAKK